MGKKKANSKSSQSAKDEETQPSEEFLRCLNMVGQNLVEPSTIERNQPMDQSDLKEKKEQRENAAKEEFLRMRVSAALPNDPEERRKVIVERLAAVRAQQETSATKAPSEKSAAGYPQSKEAPEVASEERPGPPADDVRLLQQDPLFVAKSKLHGWGVFASRKIKKDEMIHVAPFRTLDLMTAVAPAAPLNSETEGDVMVMKVMPKELQSDLFQGRDGQERLLVLGFGSFFNHADEPSVGYKFDHNAGLCRYWALKDLPADQEVFISYGSTYFAERGFDKK